MIDGIVEMIVANFGGSVPKELIVFLVSMIPILELRGSILAAGFLKMEFLSTFMIAVLGNMLPIPFILLFIRKIFNWLKRFNKIGSIIIKLEEKSLSKADNVRKYKLWGLFLFVAIPLPGTGAWTGALIADLLGMKTKEAFPVIAAGVAVAGCIISALSYGLFGLLGF